MAQEERLAGPSTVLVGEVQNLYKTTKPSAMASHEIPSSILDLHGYTRVEALTKLDKSLNVWVDAAIRGSYPFVHPVLIVCGCGNQMLNETVQEWIRANDTVANAPKKSRSKAILDTRF
jgi:hypothetical protein